MEVEIASHGLPSACFTNDNEDPEKNPECLQAKFGKQIPEDIENTIYTAMKNARNSGCLRGGRQTSESF